MHLHLISPPSVTYLFVPRSVLFLPRSSTPFCLAKPKPQSIIQRHRLLYATLAKRLVKRPECEYTLRPSSDLYMVCNWFIIVSSTDCDFHYFTSAPALRHIHETYSTNPERDCASRPSNGLDKVCNWFIIVSSTDCDLRYFANASALRHIHETYSTNPERDCASRPSSGL